MKAKHEFNFLVYRSRIIGIIGGLLICVPLFYQPIIDSGFHGVLFITGFVLAIIAFFDAWYVSSKGKLKKVIEEMKNEEQKELESKQPWD